MTRCPACDSPRSRSAFSLHGYTFVRCRGCRSLYVTERPPEGEVHELYSGESYFVADDYGVPGHGGSFHGYKDYLADREHIEQKFDEVLDHVESRLEGGGRPQPRLFDVGAGPGFLVAAAARRGWDARGIDLNEWAARFATGELGVDVAVGTLADAGIADSELDVLTMMDLIEHIPEPGELIAESARVIRPGGILALLTPDAGSPVSRALGVRWPEVQRAEHLVLFSVEGLSALLERHGFDPLGWHSVGKTSTLRTLTSDVAPAAPAIADRVAPLLERSSLGEFTFELDPRTKFVLYAKRREGEARPGRSPRTPHWPKRVGDRSKEEAILSELETLAQARRLCDWMFEQFAPYARGTVVEVGAGIGTFSERFLAAGVERLLAIEPEESCAEVLERRFADEERVTCARDWLPDSPLLAANAGGCDLVVCQNVLEHIEDHAAAVAAMAGALKPGGRLVLLVPSHPRLFGSLDAAYGHWRRYTPEMLREVCESAGLVVDDLYHFNALGILGWWTKSRRGSAEIGSTALRAYEAMMSGWRLLERRRRPPVGLSVVAIARRP